MIWQIDHEALCLGLEPRGDPREVAPSPEEAVQKHDPGFTRGITDECGMQLKRRHPATLPRLVKRAAQQITKHIKIDTTQSCQVETSLT